MFGRILTTTMGSLVGAGELGLVLANGARVNFGRDDPEVVIRLGDPSAERALVLDPDLRLGELFMDGRLTLERGSIYDFLDLMLAGLTSQRASFMSPVLDGLRRSTRRLMQRNSLMRARANVARHYDIGDDLYALFLDDDWQYSCAYFETDDMSLEQAQLAKKRHIAAKLCLRDGDSVLDIGCGWGGLALYLAQNAGAGRVAGVTLSERQLARARSRREASPARERLSFDLVDYRKVRGRYDRIVSVGMFEHVGIGHYDEYFAACRRLLADDGVMLLHTIVHVGGPAFTNPWIARYIFPGGYIPSLSEILPAIERNGLVVTDIEALRLHYAITLRHWRQRFLANRDKALALYDERFCRMWEFYLAVSEAAFRHQSIAVHQIQLAVRQESVPLTRGYLARNEALLRTREADPGREAGAA